MLDGLKNTRIVFDQPNILGSQGGSKKSPASVKGGLCLSGAFNFYRFSLCAFFIFLSFAFFSTAHAVKDFNLKNSTQSLLYVSGTSGNVGIGSSVPTQVLDVNGGVAFSGSGNSYLLGALGIGSSATIGAGNILGVQGAMTVGSSTYFTTSAPANGLLVSGNVGVGSTVPRGKLDVDGTIYGTSMMLSSGNTVNSIVTTISSPTNLQIPTAAAVSSYVSANPGTSASITSGDTTVIITDGGATGQVAFKINGSTSMIIDQNGNVGIGTTSVTTTLSLKSGITSAQGISFGGDTYLYRAGSGFLVTEGTLYATDGLFPTVYGSLAASGNLTLASTADLTKGYVLINPNGGNVGIGSAVPAATLDINTADNGIGGNVKIVAASADVTAADTFFNFSTTAGVIGSIAGTATSGLVAYNTFTGSHWTQVIDRANLFDLALLCSTGEPVDWDQGQLIKTRVCTRRADKSALGAFGGTDKEGHDLALSIGTGYLIVANKGEDLAIGDYLVTSDVTGLSEKQGTDIYTNATVGKLMSNVTWQPGEKSRKVPVIYEGG